MRATNTPLAAAANPLGLLSFRWGVLASLGRSSGGRISCLLFEGRDDVATNATRSRRLLRGDQGHFYVERAHLVIIRGDSGHRVGGPLLASPSFLH